MLSNYYWKKRLQSIYLEVSEKKIDFFVYCGNHCWYPVVIRRRSSRTFRRSLIIVGSICFYIEQIIIGVKLLFPEEEVAEHLIAVE